MVTRLEGSHSCASLPSFILGQRGEANFVILFLEGCHRWVPCGPLASLKLGCVEFQIFANSLGATKVLLDLGVCLYRRFLRLDVINNPPGRITIYGDMSDRFP